MIFVYVLYKFAPGGKQWFKCLTKNGEIEFSHHQTDATHFVSKEAAENCIKDLKGTCQRVNLSVEEAHV